RVDAWRGDPEVRVREGRVTEAIAERKERRPWQIEVFRRVVVFLVGGETGVSVIVVEGDLARRAREGDRQLAAGVVIAKQHVGDRVAVLASEKPALYDRRGFAGQLRNREGTAIHQNRHH